MKQTQHLGARRDPPFVTRTIDGRPVKLYRDEYIRWFLDGQAPRHER